MSEHPIKGDKVTINPDNCYFSYSQFIKRHPRYAIRWAYKVIPEARETYTVIGVHRHVMSERFDVENTRCVVVQNKIKQIFLIGNTGVTLLPEGGKV